MLSNLEKFSKLSYPIILCRETACPIGCERQGASLCHSPATPWCHRRFEPQSFYQLEGTRGQVQSDSALCPPNAGLWSFPSLPDATSYPQGGCFWEHQEHAGPQPGSWQRTQPAAPSVPGATGHKAEVSVPWLSQVSPGQGEEPQHQGPCPAAAQHQTRLRIL